MKRKQKSKIICKNLIRKFDWLSGQEDVLISVVMDSLKKIKKIEDSECDDKPQMNQPMFMNKVRPEPYRFGRNQK